MLTIMARPNGSLRSPLQLDRLAVSEEKDAGGWCHACDVLGESHGRPIDQTGALREAHGPPRSPMHRYHAIRLSSADHQRRLLGVEVALTKGGSPASDWHQGDVDVRHLVEGNVRPCVSGIPASASALDKKAERGSAMRAPRESPAIVIGCQDAYLHASKLHDVTGFDLAEPHTVHHDRLEQAAGACWGYQNRGGRDES